MANLGEPLWMSANGNVGECRSTLANSSDLQRTLVNIGERVEFQTTSPMHRDHWNTVEKPQVAKENRRERRFVGDLWQSNRTLEKPLRDSKHLSELGEFERVLSQPRAPQRTWETLRDHDMTIDCLRESQRCSKNTRRTLGYLRQNSTLARTSANLSKAQRTAMGLTKTQRIQRNPNEFTTSFESGRISANVGEPWRTWAKRSKFWHTLSNLYEPQRTSTSETLSATIKNLGRTPENLEEPWRSWQIVENLRETSASETLTLWNLVETGGTLWKIT